MQDKPIVFFDIDYTVFDVAIFDKVLTKKLAQILSIEEEIVRLKSHDIIEEITNNEGYFNVDTFIVRMVTIFERREKKEALEDTFFNSDIYSTAIYPDVKESLEQLQQFAKLGIFSKGHERFQKAKVELSELRNYFIDQSLQYFIKQDKLSLLSTLQKEHAGQRLFLVDDKPIILRDVKKQVANIFTIWIHRGPYAEKQKDIAGFRPNATIKDLKELVPIIQNL